jgi:predicted DNA-binding transcriptional regulator AlpA
MQEELRDMHMHETPPSEDALVRLRDVEKVTGLKKSRIYELVRDPDSDMPRPVKIFGATRWSHRELQRWVASKLAERDVARVA